MTHCLKPYRFLLVLIIINFSQVSWSQDTNTYILKVKKPKSELVVSYVDTFLVKGERYHFVIRFKEGKKRVVMALSDSIKMKRISRNQYFVKVDRDSKITKGLLRIYAQNEDGSKELYKVITYNIVEPEMPVIFVGNIKADSVIDKRYLYEYAKLNAVYKGRKVQILGFRFCPFTNGREDTLVSNNALLTLAMKQTVQKLPIGSSIYFRDVVCLLPSGKKETVKSVRLFFAETNKYKVGERILYQGN